MIKMDVIVIRRRINMFREVVVIPPCFVVGSLQQSPAIFPLKCLAQVEIIELGAPLSIPVNCIHGENPPGDMGMLHSIKVEISAATER